MILQRRGMPVFKWHFLLQESILALSELKTSNDNISHIIVQRKVVMDENWALSSLHGGSLELTLTVPLIMRKLKIKMFKPLDKLSDSTKLTGWHQSLTWLNGCTWTPAWSTVDSNPYSKREIKGRVLINEIKVKIRWFPLPPSH